MDTCQTNGQRPGPVESGADVISVGVPLTIRRKREKGKLLRHPAPLESLGSLKRNLDSSQYIHQTRNPPGFIEDAALSSQSQSVLYTIFVVSVVHTCNLRHVRLVARGVWAARHQKLVYKTFEDKMIDWTGGSRSGRASGEVQYGECASGRIATVLYRNRRYGLFSAGLLVPSQTFDDIGSGSISILGR